MLAELTSLAAPAAPLESPLTRHRVIGAFRRLLLAAGDGAAVGLIVDDAHLADEATVDVLHHLGSAGGTPLLAVLAYRPEPAPEVLTRGVARLARGGKAVEIDLGPLDRDDAAALVAAGAPTPRPAEVVDRIVELAQGNPFLTLELARSAVAGVPALVPTARDAVASRFVDLDEGTVAMLRRLALAGDDLDPASVVALTGSSEAEAFALLDVALRAGVLVVSGARYRFRHELVRQALVEQLPPHQRLAVHRDTALRLAGADASPGLIARHWLDGGRPDEAVDWLLAAARQAVRLGAFADALVHLGPLLDHEPDHADALCLRAEALDALGDSGAPAAYAAAARVVGEPAAQELRAKQALAQIKLGDPAGGLAGPRGSRAHDGRRATGPGARAQRRRSARVRRSPARHGEGRRGPPARPAVGRPRRRSPSPRGPRRPPRTPVASCATACEPTCMRRTRYPSWPSACSMASSASRRGSSTERGPIPT